MCGRDSEHQTHPTVTFAHQQAQPVSRAMSYKFAALKAWRGNDVGLND